MKTVYFFIFIICGHLLFPNWTFAQTKLTKPVVDSNSIGEWAGLSPPLISPLGHYVAYVIHQPHVGDTLLIKTISGSWRKKYPKANRCNFSGHDDKVIFERNDSLHFIALGTNESDQILAESGNYQYPEHGNGSWLAYRLKETPENLVLLNLLTGSKQQLGQAADYEFDHKGSAMILRDTTGGKASLRYLNLTTGTEEKIWTGKTGEFVGQLQFDDDGSQVFFFVQERLNNKNVNAIWYYKVGSKLALLKLKDGDPRIEKSLHLAGPLRFSSDCRWMFFNLVREKSVSSQKPNPKSSMVEVWGYRDNEIQPQQQSNEPRILQGNNSILKPDGIFWSAISTDGAHFQRVEQGDERMQTNARQLLGDFVVTCNPDSTHRADRRRFNPWPPSYYLVSLNDGSRKLIGKASLFFGQFTNSPDGKWLIYWNADKGHYFSYEIATAKVRDISVKIPYQVKDENKFDIDHIPVDGIAGWTKARWPLIYDNYDLWAVDPAGISAPHNITEGYGRKNHIKLRLFESDSKPVYAHGDSLIFSGFNVVNKYNGFLRFVVGSKSAPEGALGPYAFYRLDSQGAKDHSRDFGGMQPVKASSANYWIVQRESASEFPNYFGTSDFKNYQPLSNLQPQKSVIWLTSELITYRQQDGEMNQGILYKPENFDPKKKYPVIFLFYQMLSQLAFEFYSPGYTSDEINIPWFVSRGYLVFLPDTYIKSATKFNKPSGQWVYNSVVGAARYLTKLRFVDSEHMAIQGHSFGGYETEYLVAHSRLFAAAAESAGMSDFISSYLSLRNNDRQPVDLNYYETQQPGLFSSLWQRPDLFLASSPIINANKITTPLLLVHGREDPVVSWRQGLEMYMALRRLEKPSWMLLFDKGSHGTYLEQDSKDYTIRLTQFFDHYLKGYPPPIWMTKGVPAKMKGIETGYELDPNGSCGPTCPICRKKDYRTYYQ